MDSPLYLAIAFGLPIIVKLLLKHEFNININEDRNKSPLLIAAR